jgi:enoyl-CoA hydratase/carnithine racemase
MPEVVRLEPREHACVIRLERPAKLNAISEQVERELCEALEAPAVRDAPCVIFTGGEKVFSAGADLSETRGYGPDEILATYRGTGDFAERVADLAQPTLSAITGYCIGGGLELALATDFRIAEEGSDFRFPEVALGILPSWGGTQRAVRLLGPARAKELILLRERVDVREALSLGLVTEVVTTGQALPRALELAERLSGLPRLAVSVTKQVIDVLPETSRTAGLGLERVAYGLLAQTGDAAQALTARFAQ